MSNSRAGSELRIPLKEVQLAAGTRKLRDEGGLVEVPIFACFLQTCRMQARDSSGARGGGASHGLKHADYFSQRAKQSTDLVWPLAVGSLTKVVSPPASREDTTLHFHWMSVVICCYLFEQIARTEW